MKCKFFAIAAVLALCVVGAGFAQTGNAEYYIGLGVQHYNQGNYAKAGSCYLEAKAIREKILGKEHPDWAAFVLMD